MKKITEPIPGYSYGAAEIARSVVSMLDLENLKINAGFTEEDERYLRLAGEVLADQTKQIDNHWRSGISANPACPKAAVWLLLSGSKVRVQL